MQCIAVVCLCITFERDQNMRETSEKLISKLATIFVMYIWRKYAYTYIYMYYFWGHESTFQYAVHSNHLVLWSVHALIILTQK